MSLSSEQIALLQDAAKCAGLKVEWNLDYFFIPKPAPKNRRVSDGGELWCPHEDSGDLYDLMAAGKVNRDSSGLVYIEVEKKLVVVTVQEAFDPDSFESEAWAVITVCAMAQRRLK